MKQVRFSCKLLAGIVLSALLASCRGSGGKEDGKEKAGASSRAVAVTVEEIQQRPFTETLQLSGTIKAADDILVSPEEGGVVKEWKHEKGDIVQKGDVIVVLKDDVARPSYEAAAAQYNTAQLAFEKQEQVYKEQAISEMQFKSSQYTRDAAKAQSDLMYARLQRMQIKSPVSGILDDRLVDEGEMAPPGQPIARVVSIGTVKVLTNVPERYAGSIRLGTPVSFSVIAFQGKVFGGKVSFVGAAISADNRTFPVEATIQNPGLRLKPEMIAKVRIVQSAQRLALLVPEDIVQQVDRSKFVVYVENGGKALERIVQLGGREDGRVELVSGLNAGERVILSGYQNLVNGQAVTVTQ